MEIEETSSNYNQFLKRKELVFKVTPESATPKKNEVTDKISAIYNVSDKKLIVLNSLKSAFGKREAQAIVKIYDTAEAMHAVEPKPKEAKGASKEGAAAPAAPAQEKK